MEFLSNELRDSKNFALPVGSQARWCLFVCLNRYDAWEELGNDSMRKTDFAFTAQAKNIQSLFPYCLFSMKDFILN